MKATDEAGADRVPGSRAAEITTAIEIWASQPGQRPKFFPSGPAVKLTRLVSLTAWSASSILTLMQARDRLLLFIALDGAPRGLDPVRLQKGLFLDAQESDADESEKYSFIPYNYGPMSAQIYTDLEDLVAAGLIEAVPVKGRSWSRYVPTEKGLEEGRELLGREPSDAVAQHLYRIKKDVASKAFKDLLEDVYDKYPEFAANSVFRRGG